MALLPITTATVDCRRSFPVIVRRSSQTQRLVYIPQENGLENHEIWREHQAPHLLRIWRGHPYRSTLQSHRIAKKLSKMPHPMVSGRIYRELFGRQSRKKNYTLIRDDQQNPAQKCVKRVRPAKSRIIRPQFNLESPKFYMDIHTDLVYRLQPHRI